MLNAKLCYKGICTRMQDKLECATTIVDIIHVFSHIAGCTHLQPGVNTGELQENQNNKDGSICLKFQKPVTNVITYGLTIGSLSTSKIRVLSQKALQGGHIVVMAHKT